jgi:hypothetical protein
MVEIPPLSLLVQPSKFRAVQPPTSRMFSLMVFMGWRTLMMPPCRFLAASVLDVERCVFDLTGGTAAIKTDSTTSAGALTGRDNFYKNGLPSIATNAQYLAGRVGLVTAAVTAASSITLNCFSYDRFHITGTTTINTIVPGSAGATLGFSGKVFLHADAAWALGSSGNIKARTASARVVGEVVQLVYDPVTAFWYEVY